MATFVRTPLFDRNPHHGWYDYANFQRHPGNIWFVQCTHPRGADADGWGRSPDSPFLTIDYAVGQCTDNQGDVIYALPGHVENLTAAASLDLDVAGITIIGIGEGVLQPTISFTTVNTVDVDIDAAGITIEHMRFQAAVAAIAAAIDVNADDFTLRNCRFDSDGVGNALIWVQDAAAGGSDAIYIEDCQVYEVAANTQFINLAGTGTGHVIRNNHFVGNWTTACIGGAGAVVAITVCDNYISNADATNDNCINLAAGVTGLVINNRAANGAADNNQIVANACVKCENYGGLIADSSGVLEPVAT